MTVEDAIAQLEARFRVGAPTSTALAVTGQPYATICCGGIKVEGEPHPALCADEATAVRLWYEAVLAHGHGIIDGVLYWRIKPELECFRMTVAETRGHRTCEDRFAIYSRLLISAGAPSSAVEKPEVERAEADPTQGGLIAPPGPTERRMARKLKASS